MSTRPNPVPTEEEILLAFAVEPRHDRATFERYLRVYPEHLRALADCATELRLDVGIPPAHAPAPRLPTPPAPLAHAGHATPTAGGVAAPANPFARLDARSFRATANGLGVNSLFLSRVRDRMIDVATFPTRFLQQLAGQLTVSPEIVSHYLAAAPGLVSAHRFSAAGKPAVGPSVSFWQAVEDSDLTPEQQAALRALED